MKTRFLLTLIAVIGIQCSFGKGGLDETWYRQYLGGQIVQFARMFEGVRYDYANSDPMRGFDCSGFINFIYGNFNIKVPRQSSQFANYGKNVSLSDLQQGDILLFTGSDASSKTPGHLGIVSEIKQGKIYFIHAATSNKKGIMTSALDEPYFKARFMKAIRVL